MPPVTTTLVDLLAARADRDHGYEFVTPESSVPLSFRTLAQQARALGADLAARGLAGSRVLLMHPHGPEFVTAFFGCLFAGAQAVPVFPPDPAKLAQSVPRLAAIVENARPAAALTTAALLPLTESLAPALPPLEWLASDTVDFARSQDWQRPAISAQTTAFLQYTSGSTGTPRGVLLSHENLLHNSMLIQQTFGETTRSRGLSWLPLYHDMGLIGGVLQPLFSDFPVVLMSPLDFIARPVWWLREISERGITTSGGPNFAYELCARKFDPRTAGDLDLSSWRVAFSGAEPVRAATVDRFAETFGPYGFRRSAFLPCYGLAEATLIVTGKPAAQDVRAYPVSSAGLEKGVAAEPASADDTVPLIGCGPVPPSLRLSVVDPATGRAVPDRTVGEILLTGPTVARGYWADIEAGSRTFVDTDDGHWLRTGDLGFLADGELFVTGRQKDLIVVRGRNIYPHDVEQAAVEAQPQVRPGRVAAFGVDADGTEQIVIVAELPRGVEPGDIAAGLRRTLAETHDLPVYEVVLVAPGSIPKTSSGKLRRSACRTSYLDGSLPRVGTTQAVAERTGTDLRQRLADQRHAAILTHLRESVAHTTGLAADAVDTARPLALLGLDSLGSVELLHRVETDLGVELPISSALTTSLADLAAVVSEHLEGAPRKPAVAEAVTSTQPTETQRAIWFLQQLEPDSRVYHLARAFTVESGTLDIEALDRALCLLVARHDALRTVFHNRAGQPETTLAAAPGKLLEVAHVAGSDLDGLLTDRAAQPFDLERGLLLTAKLFVPDRGQPVLLLAAHHLAVDLWSLRILVDELRQLYPSLAAGRTVDLPPAGSFADYARHQADVLAAEGPQLRKYWMHELSGDLPPLELPDLRNRPPVQTYRGAAYRQTLSAELADNVRTLATSQGSTPYLVLLTALQTVLHRYSGNDTILIGTPVADRRRPAFATICGYLLNTVVLRGDLAGNPSFAALLTENRATLDAALAHQAYPLARLVADRSERVDPSRPALFQIMFTLEHVPRGGPVAGLAIDDPDVALDLDGARLTSRPLPHTGSAFDLTLRVVQSGDTLVASWEYNTDVLTAGLVEQFGAHLATLLDDAVQRPERRLGDLVMQTPAEHAAVQRWNNTTAEFPADRTMHSLIAERAATCPDVIAVRAGDSALTYRTLMRRATALAEQLVAQGVGPETPVGISLPRSSDAIIAILGVLLAGGAYVFTDRSAPPERTAHILRDARVALVITELDDADPTGIALPHCAPDNLAYIMYTSGSTGQPKGIGVSHANLVASTHARRRYFPGQVKSFLLISALGFDSSVAGLFWTLYDGGTLVLPDPGREQEPEHHLDLLRANDISHFESVPSLYRGLLDLIGPGDLPQLRSVVVAGEACPQEVYDRHRTKLPSAAFVNEYGPTEATVWCSAHRATPGINRPDVPIGTPIPNATLHLLDQYGRPAPPGALGEVHVGGAGVARGYAGQPGLTADRFRPDPFSTLPGARAYRTGDLARLLPEGVLEFGGRADRQLKIHGVRIEIGEVEAALRGCPGVADATVRLVSRPDGEPALVAYTVASDPLAAPSTQDIRGHLMRHLLTAMIPAAFCWLPELPLTPHGKIDEWALPAADFDSPAGEAATDPTGQVLSGMFADLLGVPSVGLDDDFFARGGHSLLVTQLVARIRTVLGVEIPARTVFTTPTVRELTKAVDHELAGTGRELVPAPTKVCHDGTAPLSYAQQQLWFLDKLWPGTPMYNVPVAVRIRGSLDDNALGQALNAVVRRHDALRTTFAETSSGPVQQVSESAAIEIVSRVPGSTGLDDELTALTRLPFDLARGPMVRATLFRLGADDHVLLLVMHHIVVDGWSLAVLTDEIAASYTAALDGRTDPLPAPPIQYPDFAVWQRTYLSPERLDVPLGYWTRRLADPPVRRLPTDFPRPAVQTFTGATLPWQLPSSVVSGLRELCRATDSTLFMVLLAAFGTVVARRSHADDVVIGSPFSGRTRQETEDLIGFFANTLALRLDLAGDPTFTRLVDRARDVCVEAYAHQDVPFELLVETLQPVRDLARNPLFQVNFAFQNAPRSRPRLAGLDVDLLDVATGAAMFEITVSLWESGDHIEGYIEYNPDLFAAGTMTRLGQEFAGLLAAVATDPDRPLSAFFRAGDQPAAPTHADAPDVLQQIGEQVRRTPSALALAELTYADLAERADRLTTELKRAGARPGTTVGLCVDSGPEWTAGLLAVLASGATCVPMDPGRPAWWHEQVRTDARLAVLMDSTGIHAVPQGDVTITPGTALVCYPDDAAAGVTVSREALAARVWALANVTGSARHLNTPLWTERAVWTCLVALTSGAELVIQPSSTNDTDTVHLAETPPNQPMLFVPTPALAPLCSQWTCDDSGRWYGRPLGDAQLVVLDLLGRPVPAEVPGELCVAGPAVADGYLRRDDLTEPESVVLSENRWTRTGTLVRRSVDGRLEWLGPVWPQPVDDTAPEAPFVAPETPLQRVIASAFGDLLDVSPIGVLDNFFDLGGHSLAATQVLLRISSVFRVEVPIRTFFEDPTVGGLCRAVTALEPQPGQTARIAEIWLRVKDQPREADSEDR